LISSSLVTMSEENHSLDILTFTRIMKVFTLNPNGLEMESFGDAYQDVNLSKIPAEYSKYLSVLCSLGYVHYDNTSKHCNFLKPTVKALIIMKHVFMTCKQKKKAVKMKCFVGPQISLNKIPKEVKLKGRCNVLISNIANPAEFFFNIKGKHYSDELEKLSTEMTKLYTSERKQLYQTPLLKYLRHPAIVAAPYHSGFYRALVKDAGCRASNSVQVMFPDYGNTEYVPLDQIYILASQFCYLPWQGVCGNEVNLSSKVDLLDIETVVSIHEIEDISGVFETEFDDDFWPPDAVKMRLVDSNNRTILSLVEDTLTDQE